MEEYKKKVLFLCSFSSMLMRQRLHLKKWNIRNAIMRLFKHPEFSHFDKGIWVTDFIQEFEKHPEYEYHIMSVHSGMIHKKQEFDTEKQYSDKYKFNKNNW